jgi:putative acetyltransferase
MNKQSRVNTDILIRIAAREECPRISSLLQQAFLEYKPLYTNAAFTATTPTANQIELRLKEGPVWVALQNESVVGTVSAVPKNSGLYVRSLAVLPSARGQGIARNLLQEIERFARDNSYKRLFLSTTPFLHQAIRLYEQSGYRPTSECPYKLHGTPLFTMEKLLRSKAE